MSVSFGRNSFVVLKLLQTKVGQARFIRNIQYRFQKLARKIDEAENTTIYSENLKPHNLRHSFAIHAVKTNEINYVKEFLGHENIATTQIYTDLKEKEVVERFKENGMKYYFI